MCIEQLASPRGARRLALVHCVTGVASDTWRVIGSNIGHTDRTSRSPVSPSRPMHGSLEVASSLRHALEWRSLHPSSRALPAHTLQHIRRFGCGKRIGCLRCSICSDWFEQQLLRIIWAQQVLGVQQTQRIVSGLADASSPRRTAASTLAGRPEWSDSEQARSRSPARRIRS